MGQVAASTTHLQDLVHEFAAGAYSRLEHQVVAVMQLHALHKLRKCAACRVDGFHELLRRWQALWRDPAVGLHAHGHLLRHRGKVVHRPLEQHSAGVPDTSALAGRMWQRSSMTPGMHGVRDAFNFAVRVDV